MKHEKKRILVIHHGRGLGGGLVALLGLIDELKQDYEVKVYCIFDGPGIKSIADRGIEVIRPRQSFYRERYNIFVFSEADYFNILDLAKQFKSLLMYMFNRYVYAFRELGLIYFDYDILYLNSTFLSDWANAAKKLNKKVVMHVREPLSKGIFGFRRELIASQIKKYVDRIIAISVDNRDRVGCPEKTTIVYDPVVTRGEDDVVLGLDEKLKYFVYLGGMTRIKGIEQLVSSLEYMQDNIRIFFLGYLPQQQTGKKTLKQLLRCVLRPYLSKENKIIEKINQSKNVIKVGFTDNVFKYYNSSLALICPFSKPHAAMPIIESLACGKPVIVSDVDGMQELVNSENGFVFRNGDSEMLAKVVNELANIDSFRYDNIAEGARQSYMNLYNNNPTVLNVLNGLFKNDKVF